MNFFRKKDHIFASFGDSEIRDNPEKMKANLLSLLPVNAGMEIRLNLVNADDLPAGIAGLLTGFSALLRSMDSRLVITVNEKLSALLSDFNLEQSLVIKTVQE